MSSAVHIGHLQRLPASQQDAFQEKEFFDNLMRTEVEVDGKAAWMLDNFN